MWGLGAEAAILMTALSSLQNTHTEWRVRVKSHCGLYLVATVHFLRPPCRPYSSGHGITVYLMTSFQDRRWADLNRKLALVFFMIISFPREVVSASQSVWPSHSTWWDCAPLKLPISIEVNLLEAPTVTQRLTYSMTTEVRIGSITSSSGPLNFPYLAGHRKYSFTISGYWK